MLLSTDGGVTPLLEACFRAPVSVETLSNAVDDGRPRSLHRTAVLRVAPTMLAASIVGYLLLIAGEPVVITIAALLAGSFGWAWPGGLTLAVVQRSPGAPAWAVGVLMAGLFTGAIAGPLLIGALAEHEQFAIAWGVCATCALLAAATVVATQRRAAAVP